MLEGVLLPHLVINLFLFKKKKTIILVPWTERNFLLPLIARKRLSLLSSVFIFPFASLKQLSKCLLSSKWLVLLDFPLHLIGNDFDRGFSFDDVLNEWHIYAISQMALTYKYRGQMNEGLITSGQTQSFPDTSSWAPQFWRLNPGPLFQGSGFAYASQVPVCCISELFWNSEEAWHTWRTSASCNNKSLHIVKPSIRMNLGPSAMSPPVIIFFNYQRP